MLALHAPGLLGCSLSGAGPSVLVFFKRGHEEVTRIFESIFEKHGHGARTYLTEIQRNGFLLECV
jgi:homoserine kinase